MVPAQPVPPCLENNALQFAGFPIPGKRAVRVGQCQRHILGPVHPGLGRSYLGIQRLPHRQRRVVLPKHHPLEVTTESQPSRSLGGDGLVRKRANGGDPSRRE